MTSIINTITSAVQVTDVESIVITDVADDNGTKLRSIKVYGQPLSLNGPPVFTLMVSAATADKIMITTPEISF